MIAVLDREIDTFAGLAHARLAGDPAYAAVQTIPGIGRIFGAVFVAEIGEITRFARPEQLTSWAGLTPRHHESDTKVYRGRITKDGSKLVRWAAVESVKHLPATTAVRQYRERVAARRGRNIGAVAARPQTARARLLRPARRARPGPRHPSDHRRGRRMTSQAGRDADRRRHMTPTPTAWRGRRID